MNTADSNSAGKTMGKLVALITGATSGIGFATAKLFIQHRQEFAHVIIHGRSKETVTTALNDLIKETQCPADMLSVVYGDLGKRVEVENLVTQVKDLGKTIDVLINNAGTASDDPTVGEEGINDVITVNHLHVMLLTLLLLPHVHTSGRIVFVASSLYTRVADGSPDMALETTRCASESRRNYSVSKLYNLWTSQQLARLLSGTDTLLDRASPAQALLTSHKNVTVTALCPGFIPTTRLTRHAGPVLAFLMYWVFPLMPFTTSLADGIQRVWYAATAKPDAAGESVHGQLVMANPPKVCEIQPHGKDLGKMRGLWNRSVDVLGLKPSGWALEEIKQ